MDWDCDAPWAIHINSLLLACRKANFMPHSRYMLIVMMIHDEGDDVDVKVNVNVDFNADDIDSDDDS